MFENLLSFSPPLAFVAVNDLWYSLPLVVTISLVYAATRQEHMDSILWSAVRFGGWICACMAIAFVILYTISANL